MGSMKNWMLGAAVAVGAAALGAATAQAAEFGFHMRGPVAYVPPCPGPGYVWVAGYMTNGYWVAGYWNFVGARVGGPIVVGGPAVRFGAGFDRDRDRHFDRDRSHEGFRR